MSFLRVAIRSLTYHWRVNATVMLGVAAATAVLTGALLVGDSVRSSLRNLTLDRLETIDELLFVDRFFREQLVHEIAEDPRFQQHYAQAVGVMLFPQATVERRGDQGVTRSSNVLVVGSHEAAATGSGSFWDLEDASRRPRRYPGADEIILNRQLADELSVQVGDTVTVRLPRPEAIPADSPLGEKTNRIRSLPRLKVIEIIPSQGLGRFSLTPSQTAPSNAFLSLGHLQDVLEQPGRINSILVAGRSRDRPPGPEASQALASLLRPTLEDYSLAIRESRLAFVDPATQHEDVVYDYFSLSSDRMILPPAVEAAADAAFGKQGGQRVFTYLANVIERVVDAQPVAGPKVPYSLVTGIGPSEEFPLPSIDGELIRDWRDDGIVLTDWAAQVLSVAPGDSVRLTYFQPETTDGASIESQVTLKVGAITPLTPPAAPYLPSRTLRFTQRPTIANDPALTPEVKGITDQQSIDDWEVPFTIDYDLIGPEDDEYWGNYGTTPKAFVSLATGRRLWGSRFGHSTSYRIPVRRNLTVDAVEQQLLEQLAGHRSELGFEFAPIKRRQLAASSGNTPFDVLFLLLSFFVIAAALLLVALLFRLGFEQRASQSGLLLAVGWTHRRVRRLLVTEGLGVALLGSALGILVGLAYAFLILAALGSKTWWLGAVKTPFLEFDWTWRSLIIGYAAGVLASVLTIFWSVFQVRRLATRHLLTGQVAAPGQTPISYTRWPRPVVAALVVISLGLAVSATYLSGEAQAGAFVGAGATILCAVLLWIWYTLRFGGAGFVRVTGSLPLLKLAARSAARNPGRSTMTIGLIATASFLIVSMSAFQRKPTESGTGGFTLVATSSQPVFADLNTAVGRDDVLGDEAAALVGSQFCAFRVRPGDDASCANLYKASQPRILGVPRAFVERFDSQNIPAFEFAAAAGETPEQRRNPWRTLQSQALSTDGVIPVVIDKETAMYSLQLYGGVGQEFTFSYDGRPITFRVVGLLSLSVLHGNLLIYDADFRRLFPTISGYRYALIATPPEMTDQIATLLEDGLGDQGFDATRSERVLAGLMALQNTYLRTFQSLGALGLLLGTFGLAAVQLRSVLERRGEMALLRAAGFRRRRLALLVLLENVMLLLAGLATGIVAALLAVLPHMLGGGAEVPFGELGVMLGLVLLVGIVAGALAAQSTLRVPLLAALREER